MDAKSTLYDLYRDADRWHAKLAAWIGRNPKKTATGLVAGGALGAWKVAELVMWVL